MRVVMKQDLLGNIDVGQNYRAFNILKKISNDAVSLYMSLSFLLKNKPPMYQMLVAHCIREIISIMIKSTNDKKGGDWQTELRKQAKSLDQNNYPLQNSYENNIKTVLSFIQKDNARQKKIETAIFIHTNFTKSVAERFSKRFNQLNVFKFAHSVISEDDQNEFYNLVKDFDNLLSAIDCSFYMARESILSLLEKPISNVLYNDIIILLKNQTIEFEFYHDLICGKIEWFDVLNDNKVFDFESFEDVVKESGKVINVPWNPFFYLKSVFPYIPDKILPIFKKIIQKEIKKSDNISWYVRDILELVISNVQKISTDQIIDTMMPFKDICPNGKFFYGIESFIKILEVLVDSGYKDFVQDLLQNFLRITVTHSDGDVRVTTFTSWGDYAHLLEQIENSGLCKKSPDLILNVLVSLLESIYREAPDYKVTLGIDYVIQQDISYQDVDHILVREIALFANKIKKEDLCLFYDKLMKFADNNYTVQNILCYYLFVNEDLLKSYEIVQKFIDNIACPCLGTSDYARLVIKTFPLLDSQQRLTLIENRNLAYIEYMKKHSISHGEEKYIIRRFFMPFKKYLPEKYKELYNEDLDGIDENLYCSETKVTFTDCFSHCSELSQESLSSMNFEDIVLYVKSFKETPDAYFNCKPSIQGTAETISKYIDSNKNLLADIEKFEDETIHPQYHYSLLLNIKFTEKDKISLEAIRHFIHYLGWLASHPLTSKQFDTSKMVEQSNYSTLLWMSQVIENLMNFCSFEIDDYKEIAKILIGNVSKKDPYVDNETDRDYYNLAINTVLGTNLAALIKLGYKISQIGNEEIGRTISEKIASLIQTKNKVVIATIGRYYPWIKPILSDRFGLVNEILTSQADEKLFVAWFGAYLLNSAYLNICSDIKNEYLYAVKNIFSEGKYLNSIMKERLGDHLAIMYYYGIIHNNDTLWNAMFMNSYLFQRIIWWITSSTAHDRGFDVDIKKTQKYIDEILTFVDDHNQWDDIGDVWRHFAFLLESNRFEDDIEWVLDTTIRVLKHHKFSISFQREAFENLSRYADSEIYKDKVLQILYLMLVDEKFEDKYYPQSTKCPYCYNEEAYNKLFEKYINDTMTEKQKGLLKEIVNALCNYGYHHNVENYCSYLFH